MIVYGLAMWRKNGIIISKFIVVSDLPLMCKYFNIIMTTAGGDLESAQMSFSSHASVMSSAGI